MPHGCLSKSWASVILNITHLFLFIVNGNYSDWGNWGECSVSCGVGQRSRTRACNNPQPVDNGADCSSIGPDSESKKCLKDMCPGIFDVKENL